MSRLLLSTAIVGLMFGMSNPAAAGNLVTDCETQLTDIRDSLEQEQFSQAEQRDIDQKLAQAEQANNQECLLIISSLEDEYMATEQDSRSVMQQGTSGERIIVEQQDPKVAVQQKAPEVRVQQVAPEVSVTQAQPEVLIEQAPPKITIRQPAPEVIVEQAEPKVTVRVPEPEVGVEQEDVKVSVTQYEPEISVEQAQPEIEIVQPQPNVILEEGEPDISLSQQDPTVRINEPDTAAVDIQRTEPEIAIEEARPEVDVQRIGEADIEYQAAEPDVDVEMQGQIQDQAMDQTSSQPSTTAGLVEGADSEIVVARDVLGMSLTSIEGADFGDVEDIVYDANGQHYLVVTTGGFLGIGEERRLVPMNRVSYGEDALIVMSEGDLMTGYDENRFTSVEPDFEMETGKL